MINPGGITPAKTPIMTLVRPFQEFAGRETCSGILLLALQRGGSCLGQFTLGAQLHAFVAYTIHGEVGQFQFGQRSSLLGQRRAHGYVLLRCGFGNQAGAAGRGAGLSTAGRASHSGGARWRRGPGPFCTLSSTQAARALADGVFRWPPILHSLWEWPSSVTAYHSD
jgi:hypothetical protein